MNVPYKIVTMGCLATEVSLVVGRGLGMCCTKIDTIAYSVKYHHYVKATKFALTNKV